MEPARKKILIIDDDAKHLLTTQELLKNEGYDVFIHHIGFGATNIIKNLQPDLILLDMNMPGLPGKSLQGCSRQIVIQMIFRLYFILLMTRVPSGSQLLNQGLRDTSVKGTSSISVNKLHFI